MMISKQTLKDICIFAKTFVYINNSSESMKGWRESVVRSQKLGLNHIDYAPSCSLKQYVRNITSIIYSNYCCSKDIKFNYLIVAKIEKELCPFIAKALGYTGKLDE